MKANGQITPLWIVAAFVTLTETVLGYALTKVDGNVRVSLTVFVMAFAPLVAAAFFVILWNRPYVFYPPSEYGNIDPKAFVAALRHEVPQKVAEQVQLAAAVERNPENAEAQFSLIDSMIDEVHRQFLILMHEKGCNLPYTESWFRQDIYEMEHNHSAGSGGVDSRAFLKKLEGTGLVLLLTKGPEITLSQSGHEFAKWLVANGKKADFLNTPYGGWGEPRPDGPIYKMREQRKKPEAQPPAGKK